MAVDPAREPQSQPEPQPHQPPPPGDFVTNQLQADCLRFLEEIKDVVRRRSEAGLGRER